MMRSQGVRGLLLVLLLLVTPAAASDAYWARPASLPDHFARHGEEVGARTPQAYVKLAAQLLERAERGEIPLKVARDGTLRAYDPITHLFGAYNADGGIRTLFVAHDPHYFDRQPGSLR
ncbi:MAG: repeat protein [Rhodospirillales bacterium]|jgi:pyocin large subunit-like protein|nr:repeat protein [Rhodospirillales bacterium]